MLVLASGSPRRRELLAWLGVPFVVDAAAVDERPRPGEPSADLVARLARAKAAAVAARRAADWVLGADTTVDLQGETLNKPTDRADAARMLARLGGREHRVFTAFALLAPGGALRSAGVVESRVRFRPLSAAAIAAYVETGEPDDKAGAYAIQGRGAGLIDTVEGSFTNVMGLPLGAVERALRDAGLVRE
ncbi:MAG TPA: Maf family protein [Candidatus Binatia bacterium]|nr:Maf family protein [Candidatus Binatia bacterium]